MVPVLLFWMVPGVVLWWRMHQRIRRTLVAAGEVRNPDDASFRDGIVVVAVQSGLMLAIGVLWPLALAKRDALERRLATWPELWFYDGPIWL